MSVITIDRSLQEVIDEMKQAAQSSKDLILKRIDKKGFHFLSRKNYGSFSMIEKEYYKVKGKFGSHENQSTINYEVDGNSTFGIMRIILPIMMLPTALIGGADNRLSGILLYTVMTGLFIFWTSFQKNKLERLGEKEFEIFLERLGS